MVEMAGEEEVGVEEVEVAEADHKDHLLPNNLSPKHKMSELWANYPNPSKEKGPKQSNLLKQ